MAKTTKQIDEERGIKILWREARELEGQLNACLWNTPTREDPAMRARYNGLVGRLAGRMADYQRAYGAKALDRLAWEARELVEAVATIPRFPAGFCLAIPKIGKLKQS